MPNYYIKQRYASNDAEKILIVDATTCKINDASGITEFYKGQRLIAMVPTENISLMRYMVPLTHTVDSSHGVVYSQEDCCEES